MKSDKSFVKLGLKEETARELYRLMISQEKCLTPSLIRILHYLEMHIMKKVTIGEMEEILE